MSGLGLLEDDEGPRPNTFRQHSDIIEKYARSDFESANESMWFERHWKRIRTHSGFHIECPHCEKICSFKGFSAHIINSHHSLYRRRTCLLCNRILNVSLDGDKHKAACLFLNRRRDLDNVLNLNATVQSTILRSKKHNADLDARHATLRDLNEKIQIKTTALRCLLAVVVERTQEESGDNLRG